MKHMFTLSDGTAFRLQTLGADDVADVSRLCDECVGDNLYSEAEIAGTIDAPDKSFYVLKNENDEIVGYIYYYLTDVGNIAQEAKLDCALFRDVYSAEHRTVGKIQAVGLKAECRRSGLAAKMIRFVLDELKENSIEAVFVVCWKPGGVLPLGRAIEECGFRFLSEAKKVWYDHDELFCHYCNGRCLCDAEVYYKLL